MSSPLITAEVAFNAGYNTAAASRTWTDVSAYVELSEGIDITHGRSDGFSECDPNTLRLTLDNTDGRFTAGKTGGAYYPNVKIGRPIRVTAIVDGNYAPNPSFEVNTIGWANWFGSTLARVTSEFDDGVASGRLTSSGAAQGVITTTGTGGFAVTPNTVFTGQLEAKASTTARVFNVSLLFYDAAGAQVGSTVTGSNQTTNTSTWTANSVTATSPATAVYASIGVAFASAAADIQYIDTAMVSQGSTVKTFTTTAPVTSIRFLGYVDEWPVEWDGGADTYAKATILASSRMARMGAQAELRSLLAEEILEDTPRAYFPCDEPSGSTAASDISGNNSPRLVTTGTGTGVAFGSGTGPDTGGGSAAEFAGGQALQGGADFTGSALWVTAVFNTVATPASGQTIWAAFGALAGSVYGFAFELTMDASGFVYLVGAGAGSVGGTISSSGAYNDGHTHIATALLSQSGGNKLGELYIDSTSVGTNSTAGTVAVDVERLIIGATSNAGDVGKVFTGAISHVAFGTGALTPGRVGSHALAALTGFAGETLVTRLSRYAGYTNLPTGELSFEPGMVPDLGHVDITGMTTLAAMQVVGHAEEGILFDARDNTLTFHARNHRYTATSAFTLGAYQLEADISPKLDRSTMFNDVTATTLDGMLSERAVNQTSIDTYGLARTSLDLATTNADEPLLHASWIVGQYGEPKPRIPALTVDMAPLATTDQTSLLAADVSTLFTVSNFPTQAAAVSASYFVEGYAESISTGWHALAFNVTPGEIYTDVWTIEDAVLGQYDAYPLAF